MRVLHVIPSISPLNGGPSVALLALAGALAVRGVEVDVATTDDHGNIRLEVPKGTPVKRDGVRYFFFRRQSKFYTLSGGLAAWLIRHVTCYDVVHIHGLFSFPSVVTAAVAKLAGVPYVVQPHGTLGTWGFAQRRPYLKAISFHCVENPLIRGAASLYLNTDLEVREARAIGVARPADVIPYAMTLPCFDRAEFANRFLQVYPQFQSKKMLLFLSRIHPKKGLELLIDALPQIKTEVSTVVLAVVGDGDSAYLKNLKSRADALGLGDSVHFLGFLSGEMKWMVLSAAELFILPTQSENFGIAVVEAMAAGTPVIVAREAAVSEFVEKAGGGVVATRTSESFGTAIIRLLTNSDMLGQLSRKAGLAAKAYTADSVARQTIDLYSKLISPTLDRRKISDENV